MAQKTKDKKKSVAELLSAVGPGPSEDEARAAIAEESGEEKDLPDLTGREAYEVKAGDTLSKIAQDLYGTIDGYHRLASENEIENPHKIKQGQKIYYRPQLSMTESVVRAEEDTPSAQVRTSSTEMGDKDVYQYLRSKGIPPEHAKGIFANMVAESSRDAAAEGDYWVDENDDGKITSDELWEPRKDSKGKVLYEKDKNGKKVPRRKYYGKNTEGAEPSSFGLFQWHRDRGDALKAFAKKQGEDWTDWRTQIDFMMTEAKTKQYLKKEFTDPKKASEWFTINWEVPHKKEEKAKTRAELIDDYDFDDLEAEDELGEEDFAKSVANKYMRME